MIVTSLIIGAVFGVVWGSLFTGKIKSLNNASSWSLASTSIIRYLLLAGLLALLTVKYHLILAWWTVGFLVSFWLLLIQPKWISGMIPPTEGPDENSNI
jgi:hypothetical protein